MGMDTVGFGREMALSVTTRYLFKRGLYKSTLRLGCRGACYGGLDNLSELVKTGSRKTKYLAQGHAASKYQSPG